MAVLAVLAIFPILPVFAIGAVLAVIQHDLTAVAQHEAPADGLPTVNNLYTFLDITSRLNLADNLAERVDVGVQLVYAVSQQIDLLLQGIQLVAEHLLTAAEEQRRKQDQKVKKRFN